jgi:hypothetical protein
LYVVDDNALNGGSIRGWHIAVNPGINIPTSGAASVYPALYEVTEEAIISNMTVNLQFSHRSTPNLDILLEGMLV